MKAQELARIVGGTLHGNATACFSYLGFDSRRVAISAKTCFFAFTSAHNDGHSYVAELAERGVPVFVVAQRQNIPGNAAQIVVDNTADALTALGKWTRDQWGGTLCAVTGSNGKTIVKEWAAQLLQGKGVYRTPSSYNSKIGVPLSLYGLQEAHTIALIEVGIDEAGGMEPMRDLVRPEVGVFTNLGSAHSAGFGSDQEKFKEKWLLFDHCHTVVTSKKWKAYAAELGLRTDHVKAWGPGADIDTTPLQNKVEGWSAHRIENAMNAAALALELGASTADVLDRITRLEPLEMRLQLKKGMGGLELLEDCYSSDLESLYWSLSELKKLAPRRKKMAVLSVLSTDLATQRAQAMVADAGLDRVWWLSSPQDWVAANQELRETDLANTTLLIKGQRKFALEQLVAQLVEREHSTWVNVNLGAVGRNLKRFKSALPSNVQVMAMVKALGYGSGSLEVAAALEAEGIDFLGVAYAQEALNLRARGIAVPILVMNAEPHQFASLAAADCTVELYDWRQVNALKNLTQPIAVHLKVETGMHRLGFAATDLDALATQLKSYTHVTVSGVFSHLSAADMPTEDAFTLEQLASFDNALTTVRKHFPEAIGHVLNTNGAARFAAHAHNLVRLGIGLYGVGQYPNISGLEPAVSWHCRVSQINEVAQGQTVGYARAFIAPKNMKIATLPVGYADGYLRALSNGAGAVAIGGKKCPVVGNVCMDMIMVDVTDVQVSPGDPVELLGPTIGAESLAAMAQTISYEILTRIGARVPRAYIHD